RYINRTEEYDGFNESKENKCCLQVIVEKLECRHLTFLRYNCEHLSRIQKQETAFECRCLPLPCIADGYATFLRIDMHVSPFQAWSRLVIPGAGNSRGKRLSDMWPFSQSAILQLVGRSLPDMSSMMPQVNFFFLLP